MLSEGGGAEAKLETKSNPPASHSPFLQNCIFSSFLGAGGAEGSARGSLGSRGGRTILLFLPALPGAVRITGALWLRAEPPGSVIHPHTPAPPAPWLGRPGLPLVPSAVTSERTRRAIAAPAPFRYSSLFLAPSAARGRVGSAGNAGGAASAVPGVSAGTADKPSRRRAERRAAPGGSVCLQGFKD